VIGDGEQAAIKNKSLLLSSVTQNLSSILDSKFAEFSYNEAGQGLTPDATGS
jgi:hypothetical protein